MTNEGIWGVNWQMGTLCHSNKQTLKLLKKKKKKKEQEKEEKFKGDGITDS